MQRALVLILLLAITSGAATITIRKRIKILRSPKDQGPAFVMVNKTIIIPPPPGDRNPPTNSLTLAWDYPTNSADYFDVHYGPWSGGETGLVSTLETSCTITGLVRRPWYMYVVAVSNSIESYPSKEIRWPYTNIIIHVEGTNLMYAKAVNGPFSLVESPWHQTNPPPFGFFRNASVLTNWLQP